MSLRLCQREQSSAASLLSTVQDEEKKSGRSERCHSVRPGGCERHVKKGATLCCFEQWLTGQRLTGFRQSEGAGLPARSLRLKHNLLLLLTDATMSTHLTRRQIRQRLVLFFLFTSKGVGRKYMGTLRTAPKLVCRFRLNRELTGRVLLSSCSDRTCQQPRGSVSGPLKLTTWQTGGSRGFSWNPLLTSFLVV